MYETSQLNLPLLQSNQAQKHVTVNEALAKLDAFSQLRFIDMAEIIPPLDANDGDTYFVPLGALDLWSGEQGKIAIFVNGGWVFVEPKEGWQAWNSSDRNGVIFIDGNWVLTGISA